MGITFNSVAFQRDLMIAYAGMVTVFVDKIAREAEAAKPAPPSSGIPPITIIRQAATISGWSIVGQVVAQGGWAVASEWGTGSLMDTTNPELRKYMQSDLWNPRRTRWPGAPIIGRPRGWYVGLYGSRYSSGSAEGRNLERKFRPIKGTSWFKAILKLNQLIFLKQCVAVFSMFPIHKYLIVTPK